MYLSIIIPAYNEEKRLPKTLAEIDGYLRKQNYPSADRSDSDESSGVRPEDSAPRDSMSSGQVNYEIIVVSDGSKDKTVEVVRDLIKNIKNLRLIDDEKNYGKGFVVRKGLLEAKGEFRLFTDADNSTSIDQVEKMWPEFKKGFDIVIGSRDIKGAILDPPQPWLRQVFLGEGFKFFRKIVIGLWNVEDTQCGFKCFTKKAAEDVLPKCRIDRFAFDPEILIVAKKLDYKIKEVPVFWKNDINSTVKFQSMIKMAIDLFKIKINIIKGIYG
ncbi:MAG: glycosyltransferase family 2 protein [bacterium]|nr:glycosyltransferase family 2 protein [bacterium]